MEVSARDGTLLSIEDSLLLEELVGPLDQSEGAKEHSLPAMDRPQPLASSTPAKKLFNCSLCAYTTVKKYNMERHSKSHAISIESGESSKETHEEKYNNEPLTHLCHVCSKVYQSRQGLNAHLAYKHGDAVGKKVLRCDVCGTHQYCQRDFEDHKNTHIMAKPYECQVCKNQFAYKKSLKRHAKNCNGPRKVCSSCQVTFATSQNLRDRQKSKHEGVKYVCACGKQFSWRQPLNKHRRSSGHQSD